MSWTLFSFFDTGIASSVFDLLVWWSETIVWFSEHAKLLLGIWFCTKSQTFCEYSLKIGIFFTVLGKGRKVSRKVSHFYWWKTVIRKQKLELSRSVLNYRVERREALYRYGNYKHANDRKSGSTRVSQWMDNMNNEWPGKHIKLFVV